MKILRSFSRIGFVIALVLTASESFASRKLAFDLRSGGSQPVCKNYAKFLNEARFESPPQCGLPSPAGYSNFESLNRTSLSPHTVSDFFFRVYGYTRFQDQSLATDSGSEIFRQQLKPELIPQLAEMNAIRAWRYASPIDIENNGHALDVLVWQGYGASPSTDECGTVNNQRAQQSEIYYPTQYGYVLKDDGTIDEDKTRAIFGSSKSQHSRKSEPFVEVGEQINIFKYKGRIYIATFGGSAGDDIASRIEVGRSATLREHLAVMYRRNGASHLACAIDLSTTSKEPDIE